MGMALIDRIYDIFLLIGKARAAAYYATQGNHAAAKRIMLEI
jgi:hypothetical protein